MNLDLYPTSHTKINLKQITDFNVRAETIKFLDENTGGRTNWHWQHGGCSRTKQKLILSQVSYRTKCFQDS
jgi:hypothetical protein